MENEEIEGRRPERRGSLNASQSRSFLATGGQIYKRVRTDDSTEGGPDGQQRGPRRAAPGERNKGLRSVLKGRKHVEGRGT